MGFGVGDELRHGFTGRLGGITRGCGNSATSADRDEGLRVVARVLVEHRRDRDHRQRAPQQRVAVGLGDGDRLAADGGAGAGAVFDHHRLAELHLHLLGDEARAMVSIGPPAATATMILIGLSG